MHDDTNQGSIVVGAIAADAKDAAAGGAKKTPSSESEAPPFDDYEKQFSAMRRHASLKRRDRGDQGQHYIFNVRDDNDDGGGGTDHSGGDHRDQHHPNQQQRRKSGVQMPSSQLQVCKKNYALVLQMLLCTISSWRHNFLVPGFFQVFLLTRIFLFCFPHARSFPGIFAYKDFSPAGISEGQQHIFLVFLLAALFLGNRSKDFFVYFCIPRFFTGFLRTVIYCLLFLDTGFNLGFFI